MSADEKGAYVAYEQGASTIVATIGGGKVTYPGMLADLRGSTALTVSFDPNDAPTSTIYMNGVAVADVDLREVVLENATDFVYSTDAGVYVDTAQLWAKPDGSDIVQLKADEGWVAWLDETATGCGVFAAKVGTAVGPDITETDCHDLGLRVENGVAFVYFGDAAEKVEVWRSSDGINWTNVLIFGSANQVEIRDGAVAGNSGILNFVFSQSNPNDETVWQAQSSDGGMTWTVPSQLGVGTFVATFPDGKAAWLDDSFPDVVAGEYVIDYAGTELSSNPATEGPAIATGPDGSRYVAWSDSNTVWVEVIP